MDVSNIENKYGSLIIPSGKKQVLGLQTFAEYYRLKTECQYVTVERLFHEYSDESGMYDPQSNEVMIDKVSRAILNFARLKGIDDELIGMRRPAVIKDILTHLKVFAHTDKSFFDKKGNWVHCLNGVVEFENGNWVLKPFSPHYHSRNRCNLVYDPQADCPRFKEQLLAPLLDTEDIGLMQKAFAQGVAGRNLTQSIFLMTGSGGISFPSASLKRNCQQPGIAGFLSNFFSCEEFIAYFLRRYSCGGSP